MKQIQLDEEAVEVSSSSYQMKGGETKEEWPWKLLYNNQGPGDKWTAAASKGFIRFKFKKPILIRGYGLKNTNSNPERDPKSFSFWIEDALSDDKFIIKVHSSYNVKFEGKWCTNEYTLQKPYFVNQI